MINAVVKELLQIAMTMVILEQHSKTNSSERWNLLHYATPIQLSPRAKKSDPMKWPHLDELVSEDNLVLVFIKSREFITVNRVTL